MTSFSSADAVSDYEARAAQLVPGLKDMQVMANLLLAERAPNNAKVLVLGAGGGAELKLLADQNPNWRFEGVDPSGDMLALAKAKLASQSERVNFIEGYIQSASKGPFDAAICLLTLHFLPEEERLETLRALHERLKPGAAFVLAHHSCPNQGADLEKWLKRNAAFGMSSGVPQAQAEKSIETLRDKLPILSPAQDEGLLRQAGFDDVELFYAAFTFKGWVCTRA